MLKPAGARTPEEYIEQIEEPRGSDVRALHAMITKAMPKLAPAMQWGMIENGAYVAGKHKSEKLVKLGVKIMAKSANA
jgi:hypothetical protein